MKILITIFICVFSLNIQADPIWIKNIEESFSDTVKVSGSFLLGLQYKSDTKIDKLNVLFPENTKGILCVKISSIDGRYKALIEHKLLLPVSGLTQLNFPSNYQEELKDYNSDELAVLASLGASCDEVDVELLVTSWNTHIDGKNVVLLIRSDARKDVVYVPESTEKFKCKKFINKYKVTYDKYCELKGIDISKVSELTIKRKNLQEIPEGPPVRLAYQ